MDQNEFQKEDILVLAEILRDLLDYYGLENVKVVMDDYSSLYVFVMPDLPRPL